MKKSMVAWQVAGFVFTSIAGVLLHFLFDWSSQNVFAALFSAVNESIWEHIKLLFFPMLAFALVQRGGMGKAHKNFWCIKLTGILVGTVLIPVLHYTVKGIFGVSPHWVNIAIFFVAAAIGYLTEAYLFRQGNVRCKTPGAAQLLLLLIALVFVLMTFAPPHVPLFQDPITGAYGYMKYTPY